MSGVYTCKDIMPVSIGIIEHKIGDGAKELSMAFQTKIPPSIPEPRPLWLCTDYCTVYEKCEEINDRV
jgi:hypothetical protein